MALTKVKGSVWDSADNGLRLLNPLDFGAVGDSVTDDSTAFQAAIDACASAGQTRLHISEGSYYFASQLVFSSTMDVTCDKTASMRWDGSAANVGILLDFEDSADTLCSMDFPLLFGPAISSSFATPGYGSGTQDPTTRVGTAIEVRGGNRLNVSAHIQNGFENAWYVNSTATSTCDNINLTTNTSDFCEKWLYLDSTGGKGLAQVVAKANTVWAKYPIYIDATSGYVNGCNANIEGTAFTNEDGGCGIYTLGTGCVSSKWEINQIQAGKRDDSRNDTAMLLTPTSAMAATPVEGETITQTTSGATGIVVTNTDYTLSTTAPFTVKTVSGTFDTSNQLTGSTSGALGAGSVPSTVRGLVSPWIGGDQTMNGVTYDAEQMGEIGYSGMKHCEIVLGMPMNHPSGDTDGAFSMYPVAGESVRIRDNGVHNNIRIDNWLAEGDAPPSTAVTLASTSGEGNFDGGIGSAKFGDYIYCYISADSLAAGSTLTRYLYHTKVNDNNTLLPTECVFKNAGGSNRNADINLIAYSNGETNNRQVTVLLKNTSGTALETTQNVYFWVKVGK